MLEKNSPRKPADLHMTRVFDAPRRLVFEAWSKAEYVSRWFTPRPLTTPSCEIDFRTGGVFRLVMRMPNGVEFPMVRQVHGEVHTARAHLVRRDDSRRRRREDDGHVHRARRQDDAQRAPELLHRDRCDPRRAEGVDADARPTRRAFGSEVVERRGSAARYARPTACCFANESEHSVATLRRTEPRSRLARRRIDERTRSAPSCGVDPLARAFLPR